MQYNTEEQAYESMEGIHAARKQEQLDNSSYQFQMDAQPSLLIQGQKGGIQDTQFFFKVINKCQDLDEPCIPDSTQEYKQF